MSGNIKQEELLLWNFRFSVSKKGLFLIHIHCSVILLLYSGLKDEKIEDQVNKDGRYIRAAKLRLSNRGILLV